MDADEIIRKLRGATVEPYQLGLTFPDQMIQPVPEHCHAVAAGPLTFVVESRHLTDEAVGTIVGHTGGADALFADFGGTVHVNGTDDGLEYLRFDCFDDKPHYHYVHYPAASNTVVRLDQFANGDALEWTIGRLRHNVPAMLEFAGSTALAAKVRADEGTVAAAVHEVEGLLREADARARRGVVDGMTPRRGAVTLPRIISVDDHVMEPPNVWWDRLPRDLRERGPYVRRERGRMLDRLVGPWQFDDGGEWADVWHFGDLVQPVQRGMAQSGHWDDDTARVVTYDDLHPGAWRRDARLRVLDENHTDASICFPNITRFCGQIFLQHPDKDVALLCVQAFNDWMIDEWCGHERPARLIPLTLLPLWDAELCVAEARRCAAKGAHAITFPELPASLGLPSIYTDHWDRLFAACEDTDTVINMHVGSSSSRVTTSPDAPIDMVIPLLFVNSQLAFSDWLYSGILQEFTDLRIVLSEGQVGWMPFTAQRMDSAWRKTQGQDESPGRRATELPSSMIAGRVFGCVYDDLQGLVDRDAVGVEQIMVETDFPHTDSTYPHSEKVLGELMTEAGLDDAEVELVTHANAIRVYGLDRYFGIAG